MRGGETVSDEKTKLQDAVARLKAWQAAMKEAAGTPPEEEEEGEEEEEPSSSADLLCNPNCQVNVS